MSKEVTYKIKFDIPKIYKDKKRNANYFRKLLQAEIVSACAPYVPNRTGYLLRSSDSSKDGEVSWNARYARYQYYLKTTNRYLNKHLKATSRWFEVAWAKYKDKIFEDVRNKIEIRELNKL